VDDEKVFQMGMRQRICEITRGVSEIECGHTE